MKKFTVNTKQLDLGKNVYKTYLFEQESSNRVLVKCSSFYEGIDGGDSSHIIEFCKPIDLVACLSLNREFDEEWNALNSNLWMLFTQKGEDGNEQLFFKRKSLMSTTSEWEQETELIIPKQELSNLFCLDFNSKLVNVMVCQNSEEWDCIYFILSIKNSNDSLVHLHLRYFWEESFFDLNVENMFVLDKNLIPISSVKHVIKEFNVHKSIIGISILFKDSLVTYPIGPRNLLLRRSPMILKLKKAVGSFRLDDKKESLVLLSEDRSGKNKACIVQYTFSRNIRKGVIQNLRVVRMNKYAYRSIKISPRFNAYRWESATLISECMGDYLFGIKLVNNRLLFNLTK